VLSPRKWIHGIIPVKCYKKKFKKFSNGIWNNKPLSRRHFHLTDRQQNSVISKKILERNKWYIFHISVIFRNDCCHLARIWLRLSRAKLSRNQSRMLVRKLCSSSTTCLPYTRILLYQSMFLFTECTMHTYNYKMRLYKAHCWITQYNSYVTMCAMWHTLIIEVHFTLWHPWRQHWRVERYNSTISLI
jgi:hypothetical protein